MADGTEEQAGIESEYVIPANSGRMVKESSVTSTFKAFCNYVGVEYKPPLRAENVLNTGIADHEENIM